MIPLLFIAVDPGPEQSGFCMFAPTGGWQIADAGVTDNASLLSRLQTYSCSSGGATLAIEMVASYGMPVGKEVFETVRWIGRFQQAWHSPEEVMLIYRREVKLYLCNNMRAKDAHVWQALVDKLGPIGTKKNPGPLYGVKSHARSAVAVAVTAAHLIEGGSI